MCRVSERLEGAPATLQTLPPIEHEKPLLERLRAAGPAGVGDSSKRLSRRHAVSDEPGADHDTRSSAARPAVDVDETSCSELVVDLVQRRDEELPVRDGEVADRHSQMARRRLHEVRVWLELTLLSEVEKETHTHRRELAHLGRSVLGPPGARVPAGDEPIRLDHGRRAHDATVCPRPLATSSEGTDLNRPSVGADSSHVTRLETPAEDLRERALVLVTELEVDPGTWYVRVLEEGRSAGAEADLGALVRVYWELQRVSGRADLRKEWRRLADALWSGETAA